MNWRELQEYYKDYDTPEYAGFVNSEIYCLTTAKKEVELTPDQLRNLAEINEKLEYLYRIRK